MLNLSERSENHYCLVFYLSKVHEGLFFWSMIMKVLFFPFVKVHDGLNFQSDHGSGLPELSLQISHIFIPFEIAPNDP
jgi:hypothetical protein